MTKPSNAEVDRAVTRLMREESGRVLALLARRFGDLDLADDAVQEALIEASRVWPDRGIPTNPAGWLLAVARRKAIDSLRRATSARRRTLASAAALIEIDEHHADGDADADRAGGMTAMITDTDSTEIGDEHLRLVLLCCHPALDRDAQVALTLRLVGGLSTPEIAAAFLVSEATLAQRIVRAKRKIRDAGIPLSIPVAIEERIAAVLTVVYLIFNEGYLASGARPEAVRVDLIDEAIRLTQLVDALVPEHAEIEGLLALEWFNQARLSERTDHAGDLVLLDHQDRSRWDLATIERANAMLVRAMGRMQPGPFQLQAAIAGYHANARTADDTDWPAIAGLYRQLVAMTSSPVIRLNHAVAVAMADGPLAGLAVLATVDGLGTYHLFHATSAELLLRAGAADDAAKSFRLARSLTHNPAEQRHLDRRLAACQPPA